MRDRQKQRGITFWGLCFVVGVFGFLLFLLFKLFPPYMENFKVKGALDGLARQPDAGSMTRAEIVSALDKRFQIDNVTDVNLIKDLTIEARGRTKLIRIHYESLIPMVANISILLDFDHSKEVRSSE